MSNTSEVDAPQIGESRCPVRPLIAMPAGWQDHQPTTWAQRDEWLHRVIALPGVTVAAIRVALVHQQHYNLSLGHWHLLAATIEREADVDDRTRQRAIRFLTSAGALIVIPDKRPNGGTKSNIYRLTWPTPPAGGVGEGAAPPSCVTLTPVTGDGGSPSCVTPITPEQPTSNPLPVFQGESEQPTEPNLSGLPRGLASLAPRGSHVSAGKEGDHPDHPPADAPQLSPANPAGPCGSAPDADHPPAGLIVLPSTTPAASAPPTLPATLIPFAPAHQKPAHGLAADTPASLTPNPENARMPIQSPATIISPAALARILIRYADTVLPIAGSPTRPTLAALGVLTAQPGGISDAEFNAVRVVLTDAGAVLPTGDVMFGDLLAQAGEIARRHRAAVYAKRRYKPHTASDIIPADELAPPTEEARLLAMVA